MLLIVVNINIRMNEWLEREDYQQTLMVTPLTSMVPPPSYLVDMVTKGAHCAIDVCG